MSKSQLFLIVSLFTRHKIETKFLALLLLGVSRPSKYDGPVELSSSEAKGSS